MPNVRNRVYCAVASAPGTGTIALGAAQSGFVSFQTAFASTTTADIRYVIEDGANWEIGTGVFTFPGNTLSRSVIESSNGGSLINASANAKVFVDLAASDYAQVNQTQTLTNKTLSNLVLDGYYKEDIYAITDGASVSINPANGTIQTWTLSASRTPTFSFDAGTSVTLMVSSGSYSINWGSSVSWIGGSAPVMSLVGINVIELWYVGSVLYGAYVGPAS